ncbi:Smyd4 [Symbiodinium sp. CCMP2456]|nr:Smyd4 [Symbiodinium sp. CCMP2456]
MGFAWKRPSRHSPLFEGQSSKQRDFTRSFLEDIQARRHGAPHSSQRLYTPCSSSRAMASCLDDTLAQHLLGVRPQRLKVPALPGPILSQLADLADARRRPEVLDRLVEALRPSQAEIAEFLGSHVVKAFSVGPASRGPAQLRGVEVAPLPGQGRSLLAKRDLPRGSVCIQEQPLASVATGSEKPELHAETRLALQLLAASRAGLADLAKDLLDHGGRDPLALKSRAVVAVCTALCIPNLPASQLCREAEEAFSWLGRVRINAVAVTALAESGSGELTSTKNALALYPNLAKSVNHACKPNALLRFDKDTNGVEVVISSPNGVNAGEEVTISYGPTGASHLRSERQQKLSSQYGFDCLCEACASSVQDEDFQWKERARQLDLRAEEAAGRGAWLEAVTASSAALALLRQGYGAGDVELAREECKLAGLSLRAGKVDKARELWSSAAEVLKPLSCSTDPDLVEAEEMLRRLPQQKGSEVPSSRQPEPMPTVTGFAAAGSRSDFAAALRRLQNAIDTASLGKGPGSSKRPQSKVEADTTTVTDSFAGAIFGLESLNLSPAEKAKLQAAMSSG